MIKKNSKPLFTGTQIADRLREISAEIVAEKISSEVKELLLVPIMAGAKRACGQIRIFFEEEFAGRDSVSPSIAEKPLYVKRSEGTKLIEPSLVNFHYSKEDFAGKTVIIVDDLVDEGLTLQLVHETIKRFHPFQLMSVVVVKKSDIHTNGWLDYSAFQLRYPLKKARKRWLFGYGMDIKGKGRDLDFIGEITL